MNYQTELLALAREIATGEGVPLAQALEQAARELRGLTLYAHDWDRSAAEHQWSMLTVARTA